MLAVNLFKHSVGLVFRNFGSAVLTSVPFAVYLILSFVLLGPKSFTGEIQNLLTEEGVIGKFFLILIVFVFICAWVAVLWHRFVLLEERPGFQLPVLSRSRVFRYIGQSILLGLAIGLLTMVLGVVVSLALPVQILLHPIYGGLMVGVLISIPVMWLFYRWSLILPAGALDNPMSFGGSWRETSEHAGTIFGLCLLLAAMQLFTTWFVTLTNESSIVVSAIITLAVQWLTFMIGISVLTTLYGHIVENRTLG